MSKFERMPVGLMFGICLALGMSGCADEATPPAGADRGAVSPVNSTTTPQAPMKQLTEEDWKRMDEESKAKLAAAEKALQDGADKAQKNFDQIRKDLDSANKKAADDAAKADKQAFDKFDAATQQTPKETQPADTSKP